MAALVGLWRYRWLGPALRFVALLACFDAVTEVTFAVFNWLLVPNLFLMPFSLAGEALLLTLAYRQALASARLNQVLPWALGTYLVFLLGEAWLRLGTVQYFATSQVISNLYTLTLAALYFRRLLNELHVAQLSRDPFFWLSVGLTGFALGNMFIMLSSDYVMAHYSVAVQRLVLLSIRNLFNILLYAAYLVALWMRPPKPSF